ncbi:MAG: hypothetical protein ABI837_02200 [Acidobacteriota bacterium]
MLEIATHAFVASAAGGLAAILYGGALPAARRVSCFLCNFHNSVGYWPEMLGSSFGLGPLALDPNYPRFNPNDPYFDENPNRFFDFAGTMIGADGQAFYEGEAITPFTYPDDLTVVIDANVEWIKKL